MRRPLPAVAAALSLAGCLGEGERGAGSRSAPGIAPPADPGPGSRAAVSCLETADPRRPADSGPAVVALLGDFDRYPSELRGPVNRLPRAGHFFYAKRVAAILASVLPKPGRRP